MPTVTSITELESAINNRIQMALKTTEDEIYNAVYKRITMYYQEKVFKQSSEHGTTFSAIPSLYTRTYQFLNSLVKTNIKNNNGTLSCEVKINTSALKYKQSGEIVVNMINRGYHADPSINDNNYKAPKSIPSNENFWNDAINDLGGESGILDIVKKNFKKFGIPIS